MIYICIEGNIGAGKTTLVKAIEHRHPVQAIYEQFKENPFLELFYENPEKHSFPLEMSFLAERFQQLNSIFTATNSKNHTYVSDYSFLKCLIFASQTLQEQDLYLFERFFKILSSQLPQPDYIFFLQDEANQLQKNISKRDRIFERNIKNEYLKSIELSYNRHLIESEKTKIIQIPAYFRHHKKIDALADAVFHCDIELITQIIALNENSS